MKPMAPPRFADRGGDAGRIADGSAWLDVSKHFEFTVSPNLVSCSLLGPLVDISEVIS